MSEKRKEVRTYEVRYICDECGSDKVYPTGMVLTSHPPKYPHVCIECAKNYTFKEKYPYTEYETIND